MLANTSINIQKEISQLVRGRQTSGSHATDEERRGEKIGATIALAKNDIGQDQQVEDDVEAENSLPSVDFLRPDRRLPFPTCRAYSGNPARGIRGSRESILAAVPSRADRRGPNGRSGSRDMGREMNGRRGSTRPGRADCRTCRGS